MAGIKISDLPSVVTPMLTDVFPIDQGAVTYKEDLSQVFSLFQANGEALTRVNDTNVTMTLGGSPNTALLNATSMTLGWSGQLAVSRGGTANSTFTAYSVICAGTTATGAFQNVSGLGSAGEVLTSNGAGALPSWQPATTITPSPLTRVDDTNVTLTLGGTPATALLQSVSITAGWSGQLSLARGGTNANLTASNGGIFYSTATAGAILAGTATPNLPLLSGSSSAPSWGAFAISLGGALTTAGALTTSGAFGATFTFTNTTSVTFPTSGTLATTSQIPTGAALTKTDDTNVTLTLGGSPATALVNAASLTLGWTGQLALSRGGTNANLTASNGGIFYSTSTAGAILAGTATAGLALLSGSNAAPTWSSSPPITRINVQRVTASGSGTYTPTTGMKYVIVQAQAAGGGSGGVAASNASQWAMSAGGGGGEYIEALFTASDIGASKAYSVGAKGTGGSAGNNAGTTGGNTTFNTTWIIATGGAGGAGSASAGIGASMTFFVNPSGSGTGGSVSTGTLIQQIAGGNNREAYAGAALGQAFTSGGGNSGSGYLGVSGAVANHTSAGAGAAAATNSGAGGSGAFSSNSSSSAAGANGGDGWINFIEFISV